jgi:hypothetical protein
MNPPLQIAPNEMNNMENSPIDQTTVGEDIILPHEINENGLEAGGYRIRPYTTPHRMK